MQMPVVRYKGREQRIAKSKIFDESYESIETIEKGKYHGYDCSRYLKSALSPGNVSVHVD